MGGDGDGYVTHPWVGMVMGRYVTHPWVGMVYSPVGGGGVTHPWVGMVMGMLHSRLSESRVNLTSR